MRAIISTVVARVYAPHLARGPGPKTWWAFTPYRPGILRNCPRNLRVDENQGGILPNRGHILVPVR